LLKIIHLISAIWLGGAEKVAVDITRNVYTSMIEAEIIGIYKDDSEYSIAIKSKLDQKGIRRREFGIKRRDQFSKFIGILISISQLRFICADIRHILYILY
jgi:hypothetical protein